MTVQQHAATLLDALGQRLGIAGLAFDERGLCTLSFDRRLSVNLVVDARLNGVVLMAVLGEFAPLARPELMLAMLRGNFLWRSTQGATLTLDPERDAALLVQCLALEQMPSAQDAGYWIETQLNTFVNTGLSWMDRLAEAPSHASAPGRLPPDLMLRV